MSRFAPAASGSGIPEAEVLAGSGRGRHGHLPLSGLIPASTLVWEGFQGKMERREERGRGMEGSGGTVDGLEPRKP